jgi:hypothetical protein
MSADPALPAPQPADFGKLLDELQEALSMRAVAALNPGAKGEANPIHARVKRARKALDAAIERLRSPAPLREPSEEALNAAMHSFHGERIGLWPKDVREALCAAYAIDGLVVRQPDTARLDWLEAHGHFGYCFTSLGTQIADMWTVDLPKKQHKSLRGAIDAELGLGGSSPANGDTK